MRLAGYDYSLSGAYFVTVCTHGRECLFGEIVADQMRLSPSGESVASVWQALPEHYAHVQLDAFVVMPNHVHGVVVLAPDEAARVRHGLSEVIRGFKTFSARRVNELRNARGVAVWQRSFHDQVIRDAAILRDIRNYIAANPSQWLNDREHPGGAGL
jgi:REP element-mobilizing transposase RayT